MTMESKPAERLKESVVIIFDEATMADQFILAAIDKLLRTIMDNEDPFGGKIILLGESRVVE